MSGDDRHSEEGDPAGEPIAELALLREQPRSDFGRRIRNSIQRRIAAADCLDFSLMALFETFLGYLTALLQAVDRRPSGGGKGDR